MNTFLEIHLDDERQEIIVSNIEYSSSDLFH